MKKITSFQGRVLTARIFALNAANRRMFPIYPWETFACSLRSLRIFGQSVPGLICNNNMKVAIYCCLEQSRLLIFEVFFTIDVNIESFTLSIESFTPTSKYLLSLSKLLSLHQNSVFLTRKTMLKSCTSISTKTKNHLDGCLQVIFHFLTFSPDICINLFSFSLI